MLTGTTIQQLPISEFDGTIRLASLGSLRTMAKEKVGILSVVLLVA